MKAKEIQLTLTPEEFDILYNFVGDGPGKIKELRDIHWKMTEIKKRLDFVKDNTNR